MTSTIGREVDGDAQASHLVAAVQRHAVDLVGGVVCASTRADGAVPISLDSRDTRPPSSSTLTASGSAGAGDIRPAAVRQHRQVGPAADEDAADVLVATTAWASSPLHPDHQQLRQLVAGRHRGEHCCRIPQTPGSAGGIGLADDEVAGAEFGRCEEWPQPAISAVTAANTASTRGNPIRPCCHEVMPAMRPATSQWPRPRLLLGWAAMNCFVAPAAASVVVGLLLGAAAIFGVTLMVQQDTKPPLLWGDPQSSVLNRVEYGNRS